GEEVCWLVTLGGPGRGIVGARKPTGYGNWTNPPLISFRLPPLTPVTLPAVQTPKVGLGTDNVPLMVTLLPLLLSFPLVPTSPPKLLKGMLDPPLPGLIVPPLGISVAES